MRRFLTTTFTSADNSSGDIARIIWAVGVFALVAFEGVIVWRGATFEPISFATALSTLAVGHGASLRLKGDTEPQPEPR
jgi:hypothetical protein